MKLPLPLCRSACDDEATNRDAKRDSVSSLTWQEATDGLDSGPYRVRRVRRPVEHRWQLEIIRSGFGWRAEPTVSKHRTRRGAVASAAMHERCRVRRVRLQIHLGLFTVATVAWLIASSSADAGLVGFVVWVALFGAALKSFVNVLDILDASTEIELPRGPSRLLTIERWVRVDSLIPPRANRFNDPAAADEGKIRVLDPLG